MKKSDEINLNPLSMTDVGLIRGPYRPFTLELWDGAITIHSTGHYRPPSWLSLWMAKGIGMVTKFEWVDK